MYTLGGILLVIIIVGVAAFAPKSFSKRGGSSINMNFLSGLFGPKQTAVARHVSDSVYLPLPYGMPCKRHLYANRTSRLCFLLDTYGLKGSECPTEAKGEDLKWS